MAEGGGGFAGRSTGGAGTEGMGIEDAGGNRAAGGQGRRYLLPAVGEGPRVPQRHSPERDRPGRVEAVRSEEDGGDPRRGGHDPCRWQPDQPMKTSAMSVPDVQDGREVTGESDRRVESSVSTRSSPSRASLPYEQDPGDAKCPTSAMSSRSFSDGKIAWNGFCDGELESPMRTRFSPGASRQQGRRQERDRAANHGTERPATGISSAVAGNGFTVTGDESVGERGTACSLPLDSGAGDDARESSPRGVPSEGGHEIDEGESNECPGACRAEDVPAEEDLLEALARELDGDPCGAPDESEQQALDASLALALQEEEWRGTGKSGGMSLVCPMLSTESRWNSRRLPGLDTIGRGARRRRGEGLPGCGRSSSVMVSGEGTTRGEKGVACDDALGPGESACDGEEPSWETVSGLGKARQGAISVRGKHGPGAVSPEEGTSPGREDAAAKGLLGMPSPGTVPRCLSEPDLKNSGGVSPGVPRPSATDRLKGWMRCGSLKARASSEGLLLSRNDSGGGGSSRGCRRKRGESEFGEASAAHRVDGDGVGGFSMDELPDEVLGKVVRFTHLPRGVSTRFERMRVQVVRERIIGALESSAKLPEEKAEAVETAIFELSGRFPSKAYKAKAREISFNLRVGKNDPLRQRVLSGTLSPAVLVRMSSDELAPLAVRRERERIAQKRFDQVTSRRDDPLHTVTERFSCPECAHGLTQYRTWRRKAVVDRYRVIVQCLQCRHTWEL